MSAALVVTCPNPNCARQLRIAATGMAACPSCGTLLDPYHCTSGKRDGVERLSEQTLPPQYVGHASPRIDPEATPMPEANPAALASLQALLKPPATAASTIGEQRVATASPRVLGRFELRRFLAEGSFGRVYEAYDPQLDRCVALKVAKMEQMDTNERVQRFIREARAAANLRHPHIVPVFDAGKEGDSFYIATAIIPGRTLAAALETGRLSIQRAAELTCALAEALAYAHRRGVVHRDVKPANVLLDENDDPVLTDFGLAFREEDERLTHDGALMGTPQYMAPEQARGQHGNALPASDQYSLGAMFFEMLTGRPLFEGSPHSVLFHHVQSPPRKPAALNPNVPPELEDICLRCLNKEPSDRYADCGQLSRALRHWLDRKKTYTLPRPEPLPKARTTRRRKAPPLSQWRRSLSLFLDTSLWQIATLTSIFAAGLAVACWLRR